MGVVKKVVAMVWQSGSLLLVCAREMACSIAVRVASGRVGAMMEGRLPMIVR